jgi:hypothetical protein
VNKRNKPYESFGVSLALDVCFHTEVPVFYQKIYVEGLLLTHYLASEKSVRGIDPIECTHAGYNKRASEGKHFELYIYLESK